MIIGLDEAQVSSQENAMIQKLMNIRRAALLVYVVSSTRRLKFIQVTMLIAMTKTRMRSGGGHKTKSYRRVAS